MSKKLNQAIEEKKRLYLLYGQEQYIIDKYVDIIIQNFLREEEKDLNLEVQATLPKDIYELINQLNTLPFMSEYRVVVLKDTGIFEHKDKDALDKLLEKMQDLPETTVLIVKEKKVDKKRKLYKFFQTKGIVEEQNFLTEEQIIRYIQKWFRREERSIQEKAIRELINRVGTELTALLMECEKLVALAEGEVTVAMVKALVMENSEISIFQLTDALARKDRNTAMEYYHQLLKNRESLVYILAVISKQIRQLCQIKAMQAARASSDEITRSLSLHPFVVKKLMTQARTFNTRELNHLLKELVQLEWDFKRGKADLETGLELMVVRLTQKIS